MRGLSHSSNSVTGISSTAVTPSSFRYGIFSTRPRKVPGCATPELGCAREAAHVQLVDDRVGERHGERVLVAPVELLVDHARAQALEPARRTPRRRPSARAPPPTSSRGRSGPRRGSKRSVRRPGFGLAVRRGSRTRCRGRGRSPARARRRRSCCSAGRAAARARARPRPGRTAPGSSRVAWREKTEKLTPSRRTPGAVGQRVAAAHAELAAHDAQQPLARVSRWLIGASISEGAGLETRATPSSSRTRWYPPRAMKGIILAGGSGTRPAPDHARRVEAAHPGLRQADGLLPAQHPDAGGHPRDPA